MASALSARAKRGKGGRGAVKGVFCRGGQNINGGGTPYRAAEKPGRMNHRDENQEALRSTESRSRDRCGSADISRDYNYFSLSSSVFAFLSFCFSSM